MEAPLQLLQQIVENANDAIIVTKASPLDESGPPIVYVNAAFVQLTGYQPSEVLGKSPRMLQGEGTSTETRARIREALEQGQPTRTEILNYAKDGTEYWVDLNIIPLRDAEGTITHFAAIQRDQTVSRVRQREREDYLAEVSHELKTPVTAIAGALGLLTSLMEANLSGDAVDLMHIAERNSERLLRLVGDVLDIRKLEARRLELERSNHRLPVLLRQAVAMNQPYAARLSTSFVAYADLPEVVVDVDDGRIQQVLSNLLSNAAKYSPPGKAVEISAVLVQDARAVRVAVRDHGRGIPVEFRERIFEKFLQVESADGTERGGSGLGLSVAKAIVEQHGGRIGFDTELGAGTTFWFELPVVAPE